VFAHPEQYAGWPANHGAWQWGDEFLVGFLRGPYDRSAPMHRIGEPFEIMQARSVDGGETWAAEPSLIPVSFGDALPPPEFSLSDHIIRVRGNYDHGGDDVPLGGAFFVSRDRGALWAGPYEFYGLELPGNSCLTSRTRVLGDLVFMSKAPRGTFGCDDAFVCRHDGRRFHFLGTVCDDTARAVMPAVARLPSGRIVCALRRRSSRRIEGGWIDAFGSDDGGKTWRFLAEVARTGSHNGNPPALIADGDRIVCAYGNRNDCAIYALESRDGENWSLPLTLREGGKTDIGYPQLFGRTDGDLVCVYYWADSENPRQHIAATRFN
jgi:hypothetical protein